MKADIELKKLHLIAEFLKVDSEELINEIETLLKEKRFMQLKEGFSKPLSMEALSSILDQAEEDARNGKIISSQELKKKVQEWK